MGPASWLRYQYLPKKPNSVSQLFKADKPNSALVISRTVVIKKYPKCRTCIQHWAEYSYHSINLFQLKTKTQRSNYQSHIWPNFKLQNSLKP